MKEIYFDNSATTKMSEGAASKMAEIIKDHYGNPSSLHTRGLDAENILEGARKTILETLGITRATKGELVFTSGGTESNNLAILGTVFAKRRAGNEKILITDGEHSCVENCAEFLEERGFTVLRVPTCAGELDIDFIKENAKGTILASFMHVNNETGALYNVADAFSAVKEVSPSAVTHSDCVQSYMKMKFTPKSLGADLISISSHKINGARGVGALYISPDILKSKKIAPIVFGGGQENGIRSGTENVCAIAAFAEAASEHKASFSEDVSKMTALRDYITDSLLEIDGVSVNLPKQRAPHIISFTTKGVRSETMLHFLSSKGIYVSSGSACSSHSNKVSRALTAFGLKKDEADSTLRASMGAQNTTEEADEFISAVKEGVSRLAKRQ